VLPNGTYQVNWGALTFTVYGIATLSVGLGGVFTGLRTQDMYNPNEAPFYSFTDYFTITGGPIQTNIRLTSTGMNPSASLAYISFSSTLQVTQIA
jgi:hypothetical protein